MIDCKIRIIAPGSSKLPRWPGINSVYKFCAIPISKERAGIQFTWLYLLKAALSRVEAAYSQSWWCISLLSWRINYKNGAELLRISSENPPCLLIHEVPSRSSSTGFQHKVPVYKEPVCAWPHVRQTLMAAFWTSMLFVSSGVFYRIQSLWSTLFGTPLQGISSKSCCCFHFVTVSVKKWVNYGSIFPYVARGKVRQGMIEVVIFYLLHCIIIELTAETLS